MSRQHSPLTGELSPAGENADAGGILAIYRHKFLSALRRLAKLGKHTIATAVLLGASSYAAWLIYNDYVTKKELEDSNATINSRIASSYRIKSCSFSKKLNAMDADANGTVLVELQPGFSREMAQRFPVLVQLYEPKGGVLYEVRRVPLKVDRDYVAEPTNVTLNWKMAEAPQNFSSVSVRVDREGLPDVRCSYDRDLSAAIAPPIYRPSPFPAPAPTASGIRCTVSEKGGGQPLAVRDGPRGKDLNNNLPVGTSVEIIPDEKADEKWVYVRAAAGPANRPGLGFVFLDYLKCN
jgi:hypothetical protein